MAKYTVDISSYDTFRAATFGKQFDIDNAYGNQCWDGAALLWQQLGRSLSAGGTGAAYGTFAVETARKTNAGSDFEIITDIKQIKRGDIIVYGQTLGKYGHIGFADEDYPTAAKINTFGENQGGTDGKGTASAFSVKSYSKTAIIGAFRFKKWSGAVPSPTTPTQNNESENIFMDLSKIVVKVVTAKEAYNYRQTPTTSGAKIGTITKGSVVTVLDGTETAANGYVWNVVIYNGKIGWCVID
jgi:hypothetical protein